MIVPFASVTPCQSKWMGQKTVFSPPAICCCVQVPLQSCDCLANASCLLMAFPRAFLHSLFSWHQSVSDSSGWVFVSWHLMYCIYQMCSSYWWRQTTAWWFWFLISSCWLKVYLSRIRISSRHLVSRVSDFTFWVAPALQPYVSSKTALEFKTLALVALLYDFHIFIFCYLSIFCYKYISYF